MSRVTDSQVQQFRSLGYFVADTGIPLTEIAAVVRQVEHAWKVDKLDAHNPYRDVRPQLQHLHVGRPATASFCRNAVFAHAAGALLGPDIDLVFNQAFLKAAQGGEGGSVPWHQDAAFAELDRPACNCWVALTPATRENGGLWVMPHRPTLPHRFDDDLGFPVCEVDTHEARVIELEVGQMIVFDQHTPHHSGENRTDGHRIGFSLGYASPHARLKLDPNPFGERVPVLRQGLHVDDVLLGYARSSDSAPHADVARSTLRELGDRGVAVDAAFARLVEDVQAEREPDAALCELLCPPLDAEASPNQGNAWDRDA